MSRDHILLILVGIILVSAYFAGDMMSKPSKNGVYEFIVQPEAEVHNVVLKCGELEDHFDNVIEFYYDENNLIVEFLAPVGTGKAYFKKECTAAYV